MYDQMFFLESMDKLRIVPATGYAGEGISQGLARGLLVWYGDCNLTGDGMGIGSVALRNEECTFFSRSWTDYQDAEIFRRTFTLDTCMRWRLRGRSSALLTRWIEKGISAYMRFPRLQNFVMQPVLPLRRALNIHPSFETISPLGEVTFTYRVNGYGVDVVVESDIPSMAGGHLCLMNELSAAWFMHGWDGKRPVPPLFSRVADQKSWDDWEVSSQVKFVYPSEFDERWLGSRISETMKAFRKNKLTL